MQACRRLISPQHTGTGACLRHVSTHVYLAHLLLRISLAPFEGVCLTVTARRGVLSSISSSWTYMCRIATLVSFTMSHIDSLGAIFLSSRQWGRHSGEPHGSFRGSSILILSAHHTSDTKLDGLYRRVRYVDLVRRYWKGVTLHFVPEYGRSFRRSST